MEALSEVDEVRFRDDDNGAGSMTTTQLRAAVARAITTPPPGMYLVGYADREGGAVGVHDDLTATALVLGDGQARAVIIALDILGLNWEVVQRVKAGIEKAAGIPGDRVLVCCAHTHTGPVGYAFPDRKIGHTLREVRNRLLLPTGKKPRGWRFNKRYIDGLVDKLVAITAQAAGDLAPAEISWGRGEASIGKNRRERMPDGTIEIGYNPDGPVDRSVTVLRIAREEGTIATLVNFACHAVVIGPARYVISADWVGAMRERAESRVGGLCMFIQGAAGDINPRFGERDSWEEDVAELGVEVGEEVLRISRTLSPVEGAPICAGKDTVWAELLLPEAAPGEPVPTYRERLHALTRVIPTILVDPLLETRYPWNTIIEERDGKAQTPIDISALRIGDVAVAAVSMEPFTGIGLAVKAVSPAPATLFAGYTNGLTGYLPTAEEHALGGYEVEMGPHFYRLPGILARDTGERVVSALGKLLAEVCR
jgi:neutral ceramidase